MKRFGFLILLFCVSFLLTPFSFSKTHAQNTNTVEIETIYPNNIVDYVNLNNISTFDINNNYIAYTLDGSSIQIFNIQARSYHTISNFSNITKIRFAGDYLIVCESQKIKYISNYTTANPTISTFNDIDYLDLKLSDVFVNYSEITIATINSKYLKVYKYNHQLVRTTTNAQIIEHAEYNNATLLTINSNNAYITYTNPLQPNKTWMCIQNFTTSHPIVEEFTQPNPTIIDTFYFDNQELLIVFTNEVLFLFNTSLEQVCTPIITANNETYPVLKISDINYLNNQVIISDPTCKTILSFTLTQEDDNLKLTASDIILGSNGKSTGRFNNVEDIYIQGSTIYTADTINNRIHIIKDNGSYFIDDLATNSNPKALTLDQHNNLYFITNSTSGSTLNRYKPTNEYKLNTSPYLKKDAFNTINTSKIGFVSDICVNNSNEIFMLDYTNGNLVTLSSNTLKKAKLQIIINSDSQIEYLKKQDLLLIFSDSKLYCYTTLGTLKFVKVLDNCQGIAVDFDRVYTISDTAIESYTIDNDSFVLEDSSISLDLQDISNLTYDIINRQMIGFDTDRQCLVRFDCKLSSSPFMFPSIEGNTPLSEESLVPLAIKEEFANTLIYSNPYGLGDTYNTTGNIKYAIGINEYLNYKYVLIQDNEQLKTAFIPNYMLETKEPNYSPIYVSTTNQRVPVYKYPTLLEYEGERLILEEIPINSKLTLLYSFPISIDDNTFYLYKKGNSVGYIHSVDIILDSVDNIKPLNTENAKIKIIGEETHTPLLAEDKQTVIKNLPNNTRIYVEKFDKNEKYTKVIYKDANLKTYIGYILTDQIELDELDNSKVVMIILIVIAIILFSVMIVAYIVIKKRRD